MPALLVHAPARVDIDDHEGTLTGDVYTRSSLSNRATAALSSAASASASGDTRLAQISIGPREPPGEERVFPDRGMTGEERGGGSYAAGDSAGPSLLSWFCIEAVGL